MRRLGVLLALMLALWSFALAEEPYSDGHAAPPAWTVTLLKAMKADGLLVGYPGGSNCRGGGPPSRYECAVASHAVYSNLKSMLEDLETGKRVITPKDYAVLAHYGEVSKDVRRLVVEYTWELERLGASVSEMLAEIDSFPLRFNPDSRIGLDIRMDIL